MSDNSEIAGSGDVLAMASDIVSAYVSKNSVPTGELPGLITAVYTSLSGLGQTKEIEAEKPTPPISIRKSVTPDHIISLEDGRPYKSLKRHLSSRGMTPEEYRRKWGLPTDYPMVAANYAAQRSELAKSSGLGQSRARKAAEAAQAPAPRGRPRKATAEAA